MARAQVGYRSRASRPRISVDPRSVTAPRPTRTWPTRCVEPMAAGQPTRASTDTPDADPRPQLHTPARTSSPPAPTARTGPAARHESAAIPIPPQHLRDRVLRRPTEPAVRQRTRWRRPCRTSAWAKIRAHCLGRRPAEKIDQRRLRPRSGLGPVCPSMVRAAIRPGQPLYPDMGCVPWPDRQSPSIPGVA